ncbi:MAG: cyclopropane fatty acyl phospholipid synthase [Deltaproteobacteria bacterium]|nr:MAG: cyclopropane fatty acyl phospholipid synthase [Deltaproteobacteria bacterium]
MELHSESTSERVQGSQHSIKNILSLDFAKDRITRMFNDAGIAVQGSNDWDIQVHDERFYNRILLKWSLGFGESYMDGWWDSKSLDQLIYRLYTSRIDGKNNNLPGKLDMCKAKLINQQSKFRAQKVAHVHYDLGNDMYSKMLGDTMQYTCAYWKDAKTLDEAQENKLDLICRKLHLQKGEKVLELGCGWGGFAKFAAENYGVVIDAYNISREQVEYARSRTKGLPVTIHLADYRDARGTYDKVAAIGLCEHVGYKNYPTLMEVAHRSLKRHGIFLLHSIANNFSTTHCDPWFNKYIFPNGMLPSVKQLGEAMENLFVLEDWHNFGVDYDKTLVEWYQNFDKHWPHYREKYGTRFYRMWKFYLLSLAGSFRARRIQLWQVIMSKDGVPGGYESVR